MGSDQDEQEHEVNLEYRKDSLELAEIILRPEEVFPEHCFIIFVADILQVAKYGKLDSHQAKKYERNDVGSQTQVCDEQITELHPCQ